VGERRRRQGRVARDGVSRDERGEMMTKSINQRNCAEDRSSPSQGGKMDLFSLSRLNNC
jgi:hypothetical protein